MIYSSLENEKIKHLKKLQTKKYRDLHKEFLIETPHLVKEAYKSGCLKKLITNEEIDLDVDKIKVTDKVLNYLSELSSSSNVIGLCDYKKEEEVKSKVLILEHIQDPGNLGTIIRSAVAFNIDTIILSEDCCDIYNAKVLRSSQGMLFHINVLVRNLNKIIPELKKQNYKIIGTDVISGNDLKSFKNDGKFAIIMGNEGNGLTKEIKSMCDDFIYIDMNKNCESLNVAIATSIILYELSR